MYFKTSLKKSQFFNKFFFNKNKHLFFSISLKNKINKLFRFKEPIKIKKKVFISIVKKSGNTISITCVFLYPYPNSIITTS